jgi:hypothetical protein
MADWTDISDLWWLRTDNPGRGAQVAHGLQAGAQLAQNREAMRSREATTDAALRVRQYEAETDRIKMLSVMDTQLARQTTDTMRGQGMAELSSHMALAVKNGTLTDPETQAEFWNLTSRYAPFIKESEVNMMWDNTFKAAMDRKAKASGTVDAPASVDEFNFRKTLRDKYRDESDPVLKAERLDDLRRFEMKAGFTKGDPLSIEEVVGPSGEVHQVLRSPNGKAQLLKPVDESKISPLDLATYKAELKALQDAWTNMDDIILTDKKPDAEKYRRLRDELYSRFSKSKSGTPTPATSPPTTAPAFRFDPATRQLVPIR